MQGESLWRVSLELEKLMRKKSGLALYELISSKPPQEESQHEPAEQSEYDVDLDHNVLTPGRSIRISIGSIGVIAAICIALIVISYTMGFRKGSAIAREDYGSRLFEELPASSVVEPAKISGTQSSAQIRAIPGTSSYGAVLSDPRVQNEMYFTLMQTTKEGALQLAAFCRQKGLETYVVSGNNTRPYRVVAFPGSSDRNSTLLRTVQTQILAIGKEWANTKAGRGSDLKDAYLSIKKK